MGPSGQGILLSRHHWNSAKQTLFLLLHFRCCYWFSLVTTHDLTKHALCVCDVFSFQHLFFSQILFRLFQQCLYFSRCFYLFATFHIAASLLFFANFYFRIFSAGLLLFCNLVVSPQIFLIFLHSCFISADIFAKLFISADFLFRISLYFRIVSQDFLFQQIFWRAFLVSEDFLIFLSKFLFPQIFFIFRKSFLFIRFFSFQQIFLLF